MIRNHPDIVVFLDIDWDTKKEKNRQHFLISELARQLEGCSKILAVERPICFWTSPFRARKKLVQWIYHPPLRHVGPNLYIYTPFVFIHNLIAARIPTFRGLNRCLLRMLLNRVMKNIDINTKNLIAWVHHPYQLEDIGLVNEKSLVYDCYDDYITLETSRTRSLDLEEREIEILKQADWVFLSSKELLEKKSKLSNSVYLIPNAVEFEHFLKSTREIDKLRINNAGPVLGFTGKITPRLDFRLLSKIARNHLDWNFLLIGPTENENVLKKNPAYRSFVTAPNVNIPGGIPYQELPEQMKLFDVCLLPYRDDDQFNIHCSPLKLYEYLATGKPIVSTNLPSVRDFSGLVRIAENIEDFGQQVKKALEEQDIHLCKLRIAKAHENSWKSRVNDILSIFNDYHKGNRG